MNLEFEKILRNSIRESIEKIVSEEAGEAAKRVERRVKENATLIATAVLNHFQIMPYERGIKIIVDFDHTKNEQTR